MKKLVLSVALILALVGCSDGLPTTDKVENETQTSNYTPYSDMGDNIFYISQTGKSFVNALKLLKNDHPELRIVTIEGNGTSGYGANNGFYVIMEEK